MSTSTYNVTGMTCDHCVHAVTEEIQSLPGVHQVSIDLVAGGTSSVHVVSETELDREAVAGAVDEAGYELVAS